VSRGKEKEIEMSGYRDIEGQWIELPSGMGHGTWHGFPLSMERELFGSGPGNDHDRLRFKALDAEDRARTNVRVAELFDSSDTTMASCWRTALDEVFAAKGVVMKLKKRFDGHYTDPILVPSPGATQVCETCGRPVATV
jgi:hypothetical protein